MNSLSENQRLIYRLGYAGIIPFVLLTLGCWLADRTWIGDFIRAQLVYGIATLSFLGGMHWLAALMSVDLSVEQRNKALWWSVVPPLAAWVSTMLGGFGFAMLMAGFIAAYRIDRQLFAWYGLPSWFLKMRLHITCVAVVMLMLTVIAANTRG
jgi:hypothetical protein